MKHRLLWEMRPVALGTWHIKVHNPQVLPWSMEAQFTQHCILPNLPCLSAALFSSFTVCWQGDLSITLHCTGCLIPGISVPSARYVDHHCFTNTVPIQLHCEDQSNKEGSTWCVWQCRLNLAAFQFDGGRLDVSELMKGTFQVTLETRWRIEKEEGEETFIHSFSVLGPTK